MRHTRRLLIGLTLALILALVGGRIAADLYVEALWFSHLGFGRYFWSLKAARWLISLVFGLLAGGVLFANLYPLVRSSPRLHIRRRYGNIEIAEVFPRRYMILAAAAIAVLFGWSFALYMGRQWTLPVLKLANAPQWGAVDPIFSTDLSFYVFALPVLSGVHTFLILVLVGSALLVSVGHVLTGGIVMAEGKVTTSRFARRHIGLLGGLLLLGVAWGFWLGTRELLWSGNGVTGSLGYTDVHARFTARRILLFLSVLGAAATFVGAYLGTLRYGLISGGVLLVATALLNHVYPAVLQKIRVEPNELDRERQYLAMNIQGTRMAYGLDEWEEREYPWKAGYTPSEDLLARVTAGLPLWDPRPLRATYNQFQGINPYYTFEDVDYDRYGMPDSIQQVAVAVREIDIEQLPAEARTWQNLHLSETYTHGLGLVMSPAARIRDTGEPFYYVSGIPPVTAPDAPPGVELVRPSVYFGEKTTQYVLLRDTVSPPDPASPLGVRLDSFFRKLSFAWFFGDKNLLLSQELRPGTRILYERTVPRRTARLAPFLVLDPDIYPVLADGRIVWIRDAYTTTPHFPLSARVEIAGEPINYIRNSVKVTVDAVSGATRFYVVDPEDPIVASLRGAFPTLFRPLEEMPASLRAHLRYPAGLLVTQSRILQAYHVQDPRALYHQLDLWDLPVERYREGEERVEPYYVVMPDPAGAGHGLEYLLLFPMTARGRDNMRALAVARSATSRSPRVTLFHLPSEQVLGPRQVEVLIDQDPAISQQFTLWQQRGSRVIRGHLLVIPVDRTFIYVEPIFLEAESGGAAPSLERVVVAAMGRVAMGETLRGALAALTTGRPLDPLAGESRKPEGSTPGLDRLRELIDSADAALRRGDLAQFGRLWAEIREHVAGTSASTTSSTEH